MADPSKVAAQVVRQAVDQAAYYHHEQLRVLERSLSELQPHTSVLMAGVATFRDWLRENRGPVPAVLDLVSLSGLDWVDHQQSNNDRVIECVAEGIAASAAPAIPQADGRRRRAMIRSYCDSLNKERRAWLKRRKRYDIFDSESTFVITAPPPSQEVIARIQEILTGS